MFTLVNKGVSFPGLHPGLHSHRWLECVCLLFKAISIVYISFHFCSVVRPPVLLMPGTSFLSASWYAEAAWGSLIPRWPSSSTEVSSVSYLYWMDMCPSGAPTWAADTSLAPSTGSSSQVWKGFRASVPGCSGEETVLLTRRAQIPLTLVFGLLALVGTSFAHLFSFSGI